MLVRVACLGALAGLLLSGCAPADSQGYDPRAAAERLADDRQAQAGRAPAVLARLSCAELPRRGLLDGLPDESLACLGAGPPRPASASDGRPTVVNLWASWCAPCRREMPLLQSVSAEAGGQVRFVGVDVQDTDGPAAALLASTGVRYEQRRDPEGVVLSALRAPGLPVTVVFASDGRRVARRVGEVDRRWLEQALAEAGVEVPGLRSQRR